MPEAGQGEQYLDLREREGKVLGKVHIEFHNLHSLPDNIGDIKQERNYPFRILVTCDVHDNVLKNLCQKALQEIMKWISQ